MERVTKAPLPTNNMEQPTQQPQAKVDVEYVGVEHFAPPPPKPEPGSMESVIGTCEAGKNYPKGGKKCCTDRYRREICWGN